MENKTSELLKKAVASYKKIFRLQVNRIIKAYATEDKNLEAMLFHSTFGDLFRKSVAYFLYGRALAGEEYHFFFTHLKLTCSAEQVLYFYNLFNNPELKAYLEKEFDATMTIEKIGTMIRIGFR